MNTHPAFELLRTERIDALDITIYVSKHAITGAMHYHLACDNDENALLIGFATQPMTSRGEAHILEHTVLCGSQKYPVRDPFFSMIKRSLNTFMNAMTASDWTVYPFASQNKKDFFNLLRVYLDAVFFPNLHPLDFAQEGIRIELDDDDKPHYHGIVFNEMKGAMSGEIDQLYYALAPHIFPTTTYHYNSGGDPKEIVHLTHADLVKFHQAHYHPSNAIIMSFGDIPMIEIQIRLHDDALMRYDDVNKPAHGTKFTSMKETCLSQPIQVYDTYTADKSDLKMTHQVLAWLLPTIIDPRQRLALRLMEGVLIEHAGSPLRAYLDSSKLGTSASPLLGLDDSHYQMVFYAGLQGSEPEHADAVEQGILELLTSVADNEIDNQTVQTILHQIELDQRHIGGDGMPYGLTLMLEAYSTALHGGDPMDVWHIDEHLAWLRQQVKDPTWLPSLIRTHLIDNPHRVRLTLSPDAHKAAALVADEQARLDALEQTLSNTDRQRIRNEMIALTERQAMVDDVNILPKVGLEDIPSSIKFVHGTTTPIVLGNTSSDNISTLYEYHAGTNGLYYYQVIIDLTDHPELLDNPILPIYLTLLSELGTDKYDSRNFQAVQASVSSGVTARISQRTHPDDKDKMTSYLVLATRALHHKPQAMNLVNDVLYDTIFSETARMSELLAQKQATWQSRLSASGHSYAMQTACAGMSRLSSLEYAYSGLPALSALKRFIQDSNTDSSLWDILASRLIDIHQRIGKLPKDMILVCEADKADNLKAIITTIAAPTKADIPLVDGTLVFDELIHIKDNSQTDTAWLIATNVYHNAVAYSATTASHADTPALMVLAPFLRNGYLHAAIREKGGAYGGGASFDSNSATFRFYSYRDPHCDQTFAHFRQSIDWLLDNDHDTEQLTEAILGIISGMDKPGSPAGEAIKSCFSELHGRNKAFQEAMRAKILAVSIDDLKTVARTYLKDKPYVRACLAPLEKAEQMAALGFDIKKL